MEQSRTSWWLRRETVGTVIGVGLWLLFNAAMMSLFQRGFVDFQFFIYLDSGRPIISFWLLFLGLVQSTAYMQPVCNFAFGSVLFVSGGRRTRYLALIILLLSNAVFFLNPLARQSFLEYGVVRGWQLLLLLLVVSLATSKLICNIFRIQLHPQQPSAAQISLWQLMLGMTLIAISLSAVAPGQGGLLGTLIYRVVPTIGLSAIACAAAVAFLPRRKPFELGKRSIRSGAANWLPYLAIVLLVAMVQYPLCRYMVLGTNELFSANAEALSLSLAFGGYLYHGLLLSTAFTFVWFLGLRRREAVVSQVP